MSQTDNDNYYIWYRKVQYVLGEEEVKDFFFHFMKEPQQDTTTQHERDQEASAA